MNPDSNQNQEINQQQSPPLAPQNPVSNTHAEQLVVNEPSEHHSTALEVVLQWLTYSFWFWTLATTCTILGAMLAYYIGDSKNIDWVTYTIGPLIVLFIASFISDKYYRKIEPKKKHGFAAVVMVVNAVIACLIAVGSFITALVTATTLITDPGETSVKIITLLTSLIVASLIILFFIRVIYVERLSVIREKFWLIMAVVISIALLLTIIGPFVNSIKRRGDTLIEKNYYSISNQIDEFARDNNRLPDSLDEVDFEKGAKEAIETGRVSYEKITTSIFEPSSLNSIGSSTFNQRSRNLEYKLCVNWQYEKEGYSSRSNTYYGGSAHDAGKQCYDETTYLYNY